MYKDIALNLLVVIYVIKCLRQRIKTEVKNRQLTLFLFSSYSF